MLCWCVLYQYFLIWLFVPLVHNIISGYYDVTNKTEWLGNRVITNISIVQSQRRSVLLYPAQHFDTPTHCDLNVVILPVACLTIEWSGELNTTTCVIFEVCCTREQHICGVADIIKNGVLFIAGIALLALPTLVEKYYAI